MLATAPTKWNPTTHTETGPNNGGGPQDQVGHAYASTTAIYTSVGDDYKNRMIAKALSRVYGGPDDTTQ